MALADDVEVMDWQHQARQRGGMRVEYEGH